MFTVPSRRGQKYLPSRPAAETNNYRPVPPEKYLSNVPSRRDIVHPPSRPANYLSLDFTVQSRPVVIRFPVKQEEFVPSPPPQSSVTVKSLDFF